ncbi:MAG: hypothetical protein O3C39_10145 [Planctomycetota bacterium]|jgi:hypothetical protein|nr:hypothetical protein [Planctomycetota bacterium]MDA1202030.1 hypothetical protein [Planctomycetota bacterium]
MSPIDLLTETKACDLLTRLFRGRGYRIVRNIPFREYGVSFHIDGWDAKARIGFEFLSSEDDDHDDLSLEEYKTLMAAQQRGELALFVIDEVEPLSAADLEYTVNEFLDEVEAGRRAKRGGKKARGTKKKAKRATAKKPAVKKIRKPARGKRAAAGKQAGKAAAKKVGQKAAKKAATKTSKKAGKRPAKKAGRKPAKRKTR